MSYTYSKIIQTDFSDAIDRIKEELKKEGFGVLTEIDMASTFKQKLNVDFRNYRILGACNPQFAHQALSVEDEIGSMLPCNVIVQELENGVKVSAVNPQASMMAVQNKELENIAGEVGEKLKAAIERL